MCKSEKQTSVQNQNPSTPPFPPISPPVAGTNPHLEETQNWNAVKSSPVAGKLENPHLEDGQIWNAVIRNYSERGQSTTNFEVKIDKSVEKFSPKLGDSDENEPKIRQDLTLNKNDDDDIKVNNVKNENETNSVAIEVPIEKEMPKKGIKSVLPVTFGPKPVIKILVIMSVAKSL